MPCREACIDHAQQHPGDQCDGAPVRFLGKISWANARRFCWSTMGLILMFFSWVFHDFGWEVPHIFLTLRIDTCLGGGISRSLWKDWWGLGLWF